MSRSITLLAIRSTTSHASSEFGVRYGFESGDPCAGGLRRPEKKLGKIERLLVIVPVATAARRYAGVQPFSRRSGEKDDHLILDVAGEIVPGETVGSASAAAVHDVPPNVPLWKDGCAFDPAPAPRR
jgi:hypothetical protein